jgi:tRNA-2-methylthio-N6-dimethylallyladenosine synthase
MKLFTKTFGCQMNFADSDEIGAHFKERGFASTEEVADANVILIYTCTVRELAEHKAMSFIGRMRDWKKKNPAGLVVVTGCAAERAKGEIKHKFPFVDLIVGAKDIEEFPGELDRILSLRGGQGPTKQSQRDQVLGIAAATAGPRDDIKEESLLPRDEEETPSPAIQYVTTMRGCNYNCSYCIVPSVRGREIYLPVDMILRNVALRVAGGAKEIWLLGQTVNSYKPNPSPFDGYDFADLLRDVSNVSGVERVRFMSPHPYYLTPKLIQAIAEVPQVCEHMHLPVQSGSTALLKKMKRNYTRESYLKNVEALRRAIPDISITTDIIVGFPGETEQDFADTLSLVKEARFDSAYCFKYSPRKGTESAAWDDDIPDAVKEARVNTLLELTDAQGTAKAASMVGSIQEVLIEQDKGGGLVRGKTRGGWRVRLQDTSLQIGRTVEARITATHSRELHGELHFDRVAP